VLEPQIDRLPTEPAALEAALTRQLQAAARDDDPSRRQCKAGVCRTGLGRGGCLGDRRLPDRSVRAAGRDMKVINLGGATVIPGLINGHVHHSRTGMNAGREARDIETAFSIREAQEVLDRRIRTVPAGEWTDAGSPQTEASG
jgi:hypothetical protein